MRSETACPLPDHLKRDYEELYWWLEYWGDWVGDGTRGGMHVIARLEKYGDERILSTTRERTTGDDFTPEIRKLERCLASLRLHDRFQFRVLSMLHIGKAGFLDIATAYAIRRRGVERTITRAYGYLDPLVAEQGLYAESALVYGGG